MTPPLQCSKLCHFQRDWCPQGSESWRSHRPLHLLAGEGCSIMSCSGRVRDKRPASQAAVCPCACLGCAARGDATVARGCSSGACWASLPRSSASRGGPGASPQGAACTCRLPHFCRLLLCLLSSHPPGTDASRAGGHPAPPFRFARGSCKW